MKYLPRRILSRKFLAIRKEKQTYILLNTYYFPDIVLATHMLSPLILKSTLHRLQVSWLHRKENKLETSWHFHRTTQLIWGKDDFLTQVDPPSEFICFHQTTMPSQYIQWTLPTTNCVSSNESICPVWKQISLSYYEAFITIAVISTKRIYNN